MLPPSVCVGTGSTFVQPIPSNNPKCLPTIYSYYNIILIGPNLARSYYILQKKIILISYLSITYPYLGFLKICSIYCCCYSILIGFYPGRGKKFTKSLSFILIKKFSVIFFYLNLCKSMFYLHR